MGYVILAIIILGIDQLTKVLLYGQNMSLIGDLLWLKTVFNKGAAWGSFVGGRWFFICISIIAGIVFVYLLFSNKYFKSKFFKVSIGFLLGGLLGNLFDRIVFAGVRDFIYLKFINFPVFNVADIAVTIGTIMLIVYILFLYSKIENNSKKLDKKGDNSGENNNS